MTQAISDTSPIEGLRSYVHGWRELLKRDQDAAYEALSPVTAAQNFAGKMRRTHTQITHPVLPQHIKTAFRDLLDAAERYIDGPLAEAYAHDADARHCIDSFWANRNVDPEHNLYLQPKRQIEHGTARTMAATIDRLIYSPLKAKPHKDMIVARMFIDQIAMHCNVGVDSPEHHAVIEASHAYMDSLEKPAKGSNAELAVVAHLERGYER